MSSGVYWVDGPWPGRLALAARPRGGDWLEDELEQWRQSGVDTVVSLLTPDEERDLILQDEAGLASTLGLAYISYPIDDRQVPESKSNLAAFLEKVDAQLTRGQNVLLHCRQGVGRTGLVAACLLTIQGIKPDTAVAQLSVAREVAIPETPAQLEWISHFADLSVSSTMTDAQPPLKPLHSETSLNSGKLATFEKLSTESLLSSLLPGQAHSLTTRPDGTILDGHHRVHVLRKRNADVDARSRQIIVRNEESSL